MAKKHILIVDDVTTNLRFIGELLKEEYSLSMARSGDQALKMLKKIDVDLILLDVKMPKMDGIDVMEQLSKDKDLGKSRGSKRRSVRPERINNDNNRNSLARLCVIYSFLNRKDEKVARDTFFFCKSQDRSFESEG